MRLISERKFSVVLPTLLKAPETLSNLLRQLGAASCIAEILLINNTPSKLSLDYTFPSLRLIEPGKNLYVNPAWNRGVSLATSPYIILLNDDVILPDNLFDSLAHLPIDDFGLVGIGRDSIHDSGDLTPFTTQNDQILPTNERTWGYGILLLFKKAHYVPIPEDLKVWCGDDFLFRAQLAASRKNGALSTHIRTKMSQTADLPEFRLIRQNDVMRYQLFHLRQNPLP